VSNGPGHKGLAPVDTDGLMRNVVLKNQIVLGTVNAGRDAFEAAIRALITGRHPLEAYRELLLGAPSGIKNVIFFSGRA
jgi:hypothetical protein